MVPVRKYSEWSETALTIHMLMQMMGKVKLAWMPSQPEWNHALLQATPTGFSTGLIPNGSNSFDILMDLSASKIAARCTSGLTAEIPLHNGRSISDYHAAFLRMLDYIGHNTTINSIPQEMAITTPFEAQQDALDYDPYAARDYYDVCIFAHNALLTFASPFRNKKILPSMFWGTFDMTTVLFSGVEKPFPGQGRIERVAFDEQFVEFGFWPGDPAVDDPSFFALPYPFLEKDYSGQQIYPSGAVYSLEKKEFFLPLKALQAHQKPQEAVVRFCQEVFAVVSREENWPSMPWFTKPLEC